MFQGLDSESLVCSSLIMYKRKTEKTAIIPTNLIYYTLLVIKAACVFVHAYSLNLYDEKPSKANICRAPSSVFSFLPPPTQNNAMSTLSGHTMERLEGEELERQERDWKGYTEGLVRLTPGRWLFPSTFEEYADKYYKFEVSLKSAVYFSCVYVNKIPVIKKW